MCDEEETALSDECWGRHGDNQSSVLRLRGKGKEGWIVGVRGGGGAHKSPRVILTFCHQTTLADV
jgi:hypothetical protein